MNIFATYFTKICLFVSIGIFFCNVAIAQPNLNSIHPCYSIATTTDGTSILYDFSPFTGKWRALSKINRSNIKALAIATNTNTLYSVNRNMLGTINPVTGEFTDIGPIGTGNGSYGIVTLNDIYGLTYVPSEDALYATHRIPTYNPITNVATPNTNDILFRINQYTGQAVQGTFYGDDYVEIDEIPNSTASIPTIYDVSDIAFDTSTGELLILHGYQLPINDVITINSLEDGSTEALKNLLFKPSIGLTYDAFFNVFVTTIPEPNFNNYSGDIYRVNVSSSGASKVGPIDPSLNNPTYFNCIDCIKNSVSLTNCQPIIYLNDYSPVRNSYNAKFDLFSNDEISSTTIYKAGSCITLGNHFSAPANVNFTAQIQSCN